MGINMILDKIFSVIPPWGLCLIALLVCFVLLIVCLNISLKNSKQLKRIMKYSRSGNLAETIEEYYNKLNNTADEIRQAGELIKKIEADCANSLSQVGVVKFDAYNDLKGSFSFCIAVLNHHNDGFIITSLYGHDSCNTYLKAITDGKALVQLMDEEKEAVQKALYVGVENTNE